jgi:hypothetical protein
MTDELDQATIGEPDREDGLDGVASQASAAEASLVAGFPTLDDVPSLDDINLDNLEDAAKWVWRHTLGDDDDDKPAQPMAPVVVFEAEEEVTMETSNVEHDDPPPPERPAGERR